MADDHTYGQAGSDPSDGRDPIAVSEAELESVLDRATSQLQELSKQVGQPDPEPDGAFTKASSPLVNNQVPDVDRQLNDIDALLRTTGGELGAPPSADSRSAAATKNQATLARHEVPDFMNEFTDLTADSTSSKKHASASPAAAPPLALRTAASETPLRPPAAAKGARYAPGLGAAVGHAFAGILETLDRPTRGISFSAKRIIGWLALAILLISLIVTVLSRL